MQRSPLPAALLLALTGVVTGCVMAGCDGGSSGGTGAATAALTSATGPAVVALQVGPEVGPVPAARLADLLERADPRPLQLIPSTDPVPALPPGSLLVGIGDSPATRLVLDPATLSLAEEGFALEGDQAAGVDRVAAIGAARHHTRAAADAGTLYGAYALLEELGLAFLHPLAPTLPDALTVPARLSVREAPRWKERGVHLHTMHPLELTDLLNGWGPGGPQDLAGWRAQLPEWELTCEWLVANRQNTVEWVLLGAASWQAFADGPERQGRLTELVDRAHAWGLAVGADVPLALRQQHSWTMVRVVGDPAREKAQIEAAVDAMAGCGFDLITTELGFSEFTSPDDTKMLRWLDEFTARVAHHGRTAYSKVHVSQHQTAPSFQDPLTGAPLNFNFLPYYADPRLGAMPHTVQHYSLDDPAPTYGAQDFDFMRRFLRTVAGSRRTVWYPETAYWVSFDVDVPLFLPLYADRRLHDLRLLAADEDAGRMGLGANAGARLDGQMIFSSGWEWGYWLNDVVACRAAWDPHASAATHDEALRAALRPVTRVAGPAAQALEDALVRAAREEHDLLTLGKVAGVAPASVEKRNAQAYLQGSDTWDELPSMLGFIPRIGAGLTQPNKLGLIELQSNIRLGGPDYRTEVAPLLAETAARLAATAVVYEGLRGQVPAHARPLVDDLCDAMAITALRARQVDGLYAFADDRTANRARLDDARAALDAAAVIVARREAAYRVPADRIAGWRTGPTAYDYGYVWTVRRLFFWWRDEGKAVDRPWSPAYLNIVDPLRVAFGEGFWIPLADGARAFGSVFGVSSVTDLLASPTAEPTFPQGGLRQRP